MNAERFILKSIFMIAGGACIGLAVGQGSIVLAVIGMILFGIGGKL